VDGDYDIAVIGGGINGAGIARDAALRGLKVLLLDKDDFGSGTTSWSSRLIHGGLRYLEYGEIPLVFESLHERRRLRHHAPHLVDKLSLIIPVYETSRRGMFMIRLGMIAYDLLSIRKKIPRHRMLSREDLLREAPAILDEGLLGGAQYFDAQVRYPERLVIENVIAARAAGADVRNYSPVIGINVREGRVRSLQFQDFASGRELEVSARVIINAAGPWVDRVLSTVNREFKPFMGGTKGSHIIVGEFDGAPASAFYVEAASDGRPFFIIPWNGQYLIGTTDIRYDGDAGDVRPDAEEIDYLLKETNRVFPTAALSHDDIHYVYAGVRPLPRREEGPESAITRKHIILRHRREARGLISIIGGKLTTYRNLAEQAVDKSLRLVGKQAERCRTRDEPLPGGKDLEETRRLLSERDDIGEACAGRLLAIYGGRAAAVVGAGDHTGEDRFIDEAGTVLAAEVRYAIEQENAVTLTDIVHRRMMTGLRPDNGVTLNAAIATLAADVLGWDKAELSRQIDALDRWNARLAPPRGD
jgi:glycerol-3-phosphate dehydrogenase